MKFNKIFLIIFLIINFYNNINIVNGYANITESLSIYTFINDCSFVNNICNITVYSNELNNNSIITKPIIYFKYKIFEGLNSIDKPVTFFGISKKFFIFYRSIYDHPIDLPQQNIEGYQFSRIPNKFSDYILPTKGFEFLGYQKVLTRFPYYYHCKIVVFSENGGIKGDGEELMMCLTIDQEKKQLYVVCPYDDGSFRILSNQSDSVEINSIDHLKYAHTSSDVEQFNYYYYLYINDANILIGLNQISLFENRVNSSQFLETPPKITTYYSKILNNQVLSYNDIIGIVGYNDTILITGNHPSNNSLIVYSYNFTSDSSRFIYSNSMTLTHTIQPQFSTIINGSRICTFFNNQTNITILFDIDNSIPINEYQLNINISQYHNPTSYQDITYFISPSEFTSNFDLFSKPDYQDNIIQPDIDTSITKTITPLKDNNNDTNHYTNYSISSFNQLQIINLIILTIIINMIIIII